MTRQMTVATSLTQKGEIKLLVIPKNAIPIMAEVSKMPNGEFYEEIYSDSLEIPERTWMGKNRYLLSYEEANYVLVCTPISLLLLVNPATMPTVKTGNEELDRVANMYKDMLEEAKPLNAKRQFAAECNEVSVEVGVPFEVALSLKASASDCRRFKQSVEAAIEKGYQKSPKNILRMKKAIADKNIPDILFMLKGMKIFTGETKTPLRLCQAVLDMFIAAEVTA